MLNMDQTQRRDIDITLDDRLTLSIDEENLADNPYLFEPTSFVGNNWFKQGNNIVKLNIAEQDSIVFLSAPLSKLAQKDITNIIVSFDYNISNVSVNYPILSNCSLTCMDMTNYFLVENILTTQGHIDVDCSLFNFSSNVVNTAISEQGFKVGINFVGNKSNATVKLSNVVIKFKYNNKLESQSDSVINRIEPHIDFWREDDDLVLQVGGDATGKGMDHSGGDVDTYTKAEIDAKLDLKVNTEVGKGLSSNDYTLTEKTKLGTVETNANYYVHPSSHQTGMIVESSALTNLETSENATQHEINLAIDDKINQGGGSSVDIVTSWNSTTSDSKVPSEKLAKDSLDNKVDKQTGKGLSTNDFTNSYKSKIDGLSTVATSGSYNDLSNKPSIPSSSSDLSDGSNLVKKSSTSGLLKNDGTVDTSSYITSSALSNYVQKSNTTGLLKNDGTVDTTSYSTFSGSYNDLSNKPSIPSSSSDLSDGSSLVKTSSTSGLLKNDGSVDTNSYLTSSAISGKEDTSNKVTSWSSTPSDTHYPSEKLVADTIDSLLNNDRIMIIPSRTYLASGEKTDFVVKLTNGVGQPLTSKSVTVTDGTNTYTGITDTNGEYVLLNIGVTGDTTFTANYGTIYDTCTIKYCTSVDWGTSNLHNDIWTLSNFTMTREDSYTLLTEASGTTGTCQLDSTHKIAPTQTIEFDLMQVDGTTTSSPVYIRNDGGGSSLASATITNLGASIGEWVHIKIVFNNTSTVMIYTDKLTTPLTKTLSATSTNYRLMFYGGSTITKLKFKNVVIY